MLDTLRGAGEGKHIILDQDFYEDVYWIIQFLEKFNSLDFINQVPEANEDLVMDACLSGERGLSASSGFQSRFQITSWKKIIVLVN